MPALELRRSATPKRCLGRCALHRHVRRRTAAQRHFSAGPARDRVDRAASAWEDAQKTIRAAAGEVAAAVGAARNEGYGLLDRARTEAQAKSRAELDAARAATQAQLTDAKKELSEASDRAVSELEGQADSMARALASRILGRDVA